jgi:protein TonB
MSAFVVAVATMTARHPAPAVHPSASTAPLELTHLVFIAREAPTSARGGGGGGNRQAAPIRRAHAKGQDQATLRVATPVSASGPDEKPSPLPALVLDAAPLSSGWMDQIGLPAGGVEFGTSLGPGSGGGVGEGAGTGIGSGAGPGLGPGSGGGTGGGVYRVGGGVTPPRVITEIKPAYTNRAMVERIEGTVVLELIVGANGWPSNIRVVRSIDPDGLDEEAVRAASQWRFAPGRLNGTPVDVLVTIEVAFRIR